MSKANYLQLSKLTPLWIKDKETGLRVGFFFVCPCCEPQILGNLAHPIVIYVDKEYADAFSSSCYTVHGDSWTNLSVLGKIQSKVCSFKGWIRKGEVFW